MLTVLLLSAALGTLPAPPRVSLEAQVPETSHAALAAGLTAWQNAVRSGTVRRTDVLTVIDYSRPSTEPRLFVLDVASGRVRYAERVAHGRGSGENATERFSNRDGSHMTSLGVFRAGESYLGQHGMSLRLDGLEPGFNDHARERAIVLHGAGYVNAGIIAVAGPARPELGMPGGAAGDRARAHRRDQGRFARRRVLPQRGLARAVGLPQDFCGAGGGSELTMFRRGPVVSASTGESVT